MARCIHGQLYIGGDPDSYRCEHGCHGPKPAPPEVPAPDEVFVIVNSDAAPYDVYGDKANADECVIHCGGSVVRYVRAREGGR